ncbi:UNVERIFIED_ORG: hypothetical protein ABIB52_000971 [Arthrobacter sp. UYCu721]
MNRMQGNVHATEQEPELAEEQGNDGLFIERTDAYFGGLGARGRVVMSQLPLSVTVVASLTGLRPEQIKKMTRGVAAPPRRNAADHRATG